VPSGIPKGNDDRSFGVHYFYTMRTFKRFDRSLAVLIAVLHLFTFPIFAGKRSYGDAVVAKLISVHDGDTFKVNLSNMPPIVGDSILVRINGIDTPELDGDSDYERELAIKAKLYAENRLKNAKIIVLKNMRRDKYFRILADVYVDKWNLGKELVRVGLAVEYDGGKKHDW
jgi:micrococcal nuclease